MAGRILVDEGGVEGGVHRPDPALSVDQCHLPQAGGAVVSGCARAEDLGPLVGLDGGSPCLEAHLQPAYDRPLDLQGLARRHRSFDPIGIGRREDLLGGEIRVVLDAAGRVEVRREPRSAVAAGSSPPLIVICATCSSPISVIRSSCQRGANPIASSRPSAMRARRTNASEYVTSTCRAPARYACVATARARASLPSSAFTVTIWPGWTLAPNPTTSFA